MSFSWWSSNHQKKPLKNQLERENLAFLWCYPLRGHFEESWESQREDHWGTVISSSFSLPSQRMELPLQDTCTLGGVCREHFVGWKWKCLSSTAWHCVGREGHRAQRCSLFYTYTQSAPAPGSASWWLSLCCTCVAPVCALYCLGPLLCLLIHLNFLALARKNHSYYTASNLPPFISFSLPGALFSRTENDLCLHPPLAVIPKDRTLPFLIAFSLLSLFSENSSINPNCCNNQWEASNLVVIDLNNANINEWKTH